MTVPRFWATETSGSQLATAAIVRCQEKITPITNSPLSLKAKAVSSLVSLQHLGFRRGSLNKNGPHRLTDLDALSL